MGKSLEGHPRPHRESASSKLLAKFTVGYNLMLFKKEASLQELINATSLPKEEVLKQISFYQKKFGLTGNELIGYGLSEDLDQRLKMAHAIQSMVHRP